MKAIIQHNFNTGWGDGLFAMTDYINNAIEMKRLGFEVELNFNIKTNLYFKTKTPLDYLDSEIFLVFDKINFNSEILNNNTQNGFLCVYTFSNAKPSQHFYDIFVDLDSVDFFNQNIKINHFNMIGMVNGFKPKVYPKLNKEILSLFEKFKKNNELKHFDAIYFRTQDLQEEFDFLEKNKLILQQIVNSETNIFICSNSKEFKKYIKSLNRKNVYFFEIPLEDEWGGNHLLHQTIDDENLHNRNIFTFLDMWALSVANNIHFFTTWGRYSNFLFYAPINESNIIFY